jgi:hypothetical protein
MFCSSHFQLNLLPSVVVLICLTCLFFSDASPENSLSHFQATREFPTLPRLSTALQCDNIRHCTNVDLFTVYLYKISRINEIYVHKNKLLFIILHNVEVNTGKGLWKSKYKIVCLRRDWQIITCCKIWNSQSSVDEDSVLLGCDTVPAGEWLPTD